MRTLNSKTILLNQAEMAVMQTDPTVLRETILDRAVASGKITSANRDYYREQYNRDRAGTVRLLASLAPGPKPSDIRTLQNFEQQQGDELLASARASFPELRARRASAPPSPVRLGSLAHVAGEEEHLSPSGASPPATHRAGWYSRRNGSPVVKDAGRAAAPFWQNYVPPDRGDPGQHFVDGLESGPAPFPAGLNVGH